jgi:large subunit ribosomal protein L15
MKLNDVHQGVQKHRRRKRLGRGPGSGQGKTAGRGHKGQGQRNGWSQHPTFQGGMMPLVRRIPKRGFNNRWAKTVAVVNVGDLDQAFEAGADVTPSVLEQQALLGHRFDELKILGDGELTKPLKVSAHRFSKSAQEKIERAGGSVTQLSGPRHVLDREPSPESKPRSSAPPRSAGSGTASRTKKSDKK